jgi:hypothetical protein
MPPRTKRARSAATNAATNAATRAAAVAAFIADADIAPKRVRNVALASLANTHCLCGRKSAHGTAVCCQLLRDAREEGAVGLGGGAVAGTDDNGSHSNMVACVAQTLIEFARTDGGLDNVRKLEDARLATLVAPFVRGRAHCVAPGRWYCVSPPPHSRWSSADDDGAQIMCLFNDRVLPAVTRLRQHVCGANANMLSGISSKSAADAEAYTTAETTLPTTTATTTAALNCGLVASGLAAYHRTLAEQLLRDIESTLRKHDARRRIVREVALLAGIYDPEFEQRLDANTSLLGFENCVFDLRRGRHAPPTISRARPASTSRSTLVLIRLLRDRRCSAFCGACVPRCRAPTSSSTCCTCWRRALSVSVPICCTSGWEAVPI